MIVTSNADTLSATLCGTHVVLQMRAANFGTTNIYLLSDVTGDYFFKVIFRLYRGQIKLMLLIG